MREIRLFAGILVVVGLMLGVQVSSALAEVPVINSITPNSGGNNSATGVTINGSNFEDGAEVSIWKSEPLIGSVDTERWASDVYVSDSYAYVFDKCISREVSGAFLRIIDISDPSSPTIVSSIKTDSNYFTSDAGIYVSGSYAYVGCEIDSFSSEMGLCIIDISDPSSPKIIGNVLRGEASVSGVYVSGSYAYVVDWYYAENIGSFQVIDISTPSSPVIIGSVDTPDYAHAVYVSGSYAYVADGYHAEDIGSFQVIDISTPSSPVIIGSVDTPGIAFDVYVSGSYAYVTGWAGLKVIDISIPYSPVIIRTVDTPGSGAAVYVSGSYAYVADGGSGLQVIMTPLLLEGNVVDSTTITAIIPPDLREGVYDIVVSNPGGDIGTLYNGFKVVDMNGIVDNSDPDFSVQGTWGIRPDNVVPGVYGKSFHYSSPGDGSDTAVWDAELVSGAGNYEVFVWYPVYSGLASNAPFTINHADISDTLVVDQGINGGQWMSLGIYEFVNDGTENITLSDKADTWVVADAVKFEPTDLPPSTPPAVPPSDGIIDNTDKGFRVEGRWPSSTRAPDFFGEDFQYHAAGDGSDTAAWKPELVNGAGSYEIFVWYPVYSGLATDAEYIINHANGSDRVLIDQSINGASWISLGVYEFSNKCGKGITLTDNANSWVVADAVRFAPPDGIVDNADYGFSLIGVWKRYNAAPGISGYGKDLRYHAPGDDTETAAWEVELVDGAGSYEVFIWYPVSSHLATNAPYTINHADGYYTVRVDQSVSGGQWVNLGIFEFDGTSSENVTMSADVDPRSAWVAADAVRFSPADMSKEAIIERMKSELQLICLSEEAYFGEFNTYSDDIEEIGVDSRQWNKYWEILIEADENGFVVTATGIAYPVEGEILSISGGIDESC